MEVTVEKRLPEIDKDLEDAAVLGLKARKPRHQYSGSGGGLKKVDTGGGEPSENSAYLDRNGGAVEDLDIRMLRNAVRYDANNNQNTETAIEESEQIEEEITEEEVVELEFKKAIPKLNTHMMQCPNCDHHITKVVLHRKIINRKQSLVIGEPPLDLLGCSSCVSLFTSTENDGTNEVGTSKLKDQLPISHLLYHAQSYRDGKDPEIHESRVDIPPSTSNENQAQTQVQDSKYFEILRSIVYGGLIELVASSSVVTSAYACDATILIIVALAVANLVAGIFLISHNLWDLRRDCYNLTNQQTKDQEPRNKYKELLGQIEHFRLHVFFVLLSFLVFGTIPPSVYGYLFLVTNDKDFTMIVVAVVSLVCVVFLSTSKAYIERCTNLWKYVKIIMYSLTTTITVAGLPFVIGNLVTRLIKENGLSETSSKVAMGRLPTAALTNSSLAYY